MTSFSVSISQLIYFTFNMYNSTNILWSILSFHTISVRNKQFWFLFGTEIFQIVNAQNVRSPIGITLGNTSQVNRTTVKCLAVNFLSQVLHNFWLCTFIQIGGGPFDHCSIGSRDLCRLFWREHISSSWSRGTMLETPRSNNIKAWIGTAARTTRPRNR